MFCDGSTLVILISSAGISISIFVIRLLFGGTLSGFRCKILEILILLFAICINIFFIVDKKKEFYVFKYL